MDLSEDSVKTLRNPQGGRPAKYVDITEDQAKQAAMRKKSESEKLRTQAPAVLPLANTEDRPQTAA